MKNFVVQMTRHVGFWEKASQRTKERQEPRRYNVKRLFIAIAATVSLTLAGLAVAAQGQAPATQTVTPPSKLTICHKTGSDSNPWRRITVSSRAITKPNSLAGKTVRAHLRHVGDAVVVGTGACPSASVTPAPTAAPATRITICHKTSSTANPYRRITVSSRAVTNPNSTAGKVLRGHMGHTGDMMLAGATPCPSGTQTQTKLSAALTPVTGATGSGSASFTIRVGRSELCYTLTVTGLTNVTGAHIHRVSTSAVVVPLNAPTSGSASGCTTVAKALLQEIVSHPDAFYVNVHTLTYPNGQVQGRLSR
jgi:hypothetical protein